MKVQPDSPNTGIDEIKHTYEVAQKANLPLILFTTYQSLDRVNGANLPITAVYFDEAHNACSVDSFSAVESISATAKHAYFFTATPRRSESETGKGFDNTNVYGEHIANYQVLRTA